MDHLQAAAVIGLFIFIVSFLFASLFQIPKREPPSVTDTIYLNKRHREKLTTKKFGLIYYLTQTQNKHTTNNVSRPEKVFIWVR